MPELVLAGIPTCDTCRRARRWLSERGLDANWKDLRADPPDRSQVAGWVKSLGATALRNTSGASYRALGPEREQWSAEQWAEAMAADPMLIKRPVLELDGRAVAVGFQPAGWAALLDA